jgi:transposase InsO family protein
MNATAKHTPGYEVTRDGRVFSISSNWRGYGRRELAQTLNADGYPSVRIIVDGKRVRKSVHGLVAKNHLPPRPSAAHEVRHLDGNKLNPHADNLAWGTRKENAEDRERHGRTSRGPSHSDAIKASNQANGTRAFRLAQGEANHV